ncbi:MAG: DMT family transporter [Candidatus Eisenbacteria bacterium]|uniref:DMT family transporter n=1 Tax=Eiseniibacteriota bacterium TaxID=2212470 RepID=A0A948WCA5_UNCEI|nr:DMT family transporter [Candidatus Eisenbacteria bacterium]MBU1949595.1 DMT family transporter [Candidatus Eisenbacteria bacterium]MBU2690743.1 DMT family transporter [Candidatus Eisenbacteria bacterium]
MPFIGEIAALTTATCWAFGSLLFTIAARRAGAFSLNAVRIPIAFAALTLILLASRGLQWAPQAQTRDILILALSGVIGLTLGDWGYFACLERLGPRLATALFTLAPPLTAILAIPLLGEKLGLLPVIGMVITMTGVAWVIMERPGKPIPRGHRIQGVVFGFIASFGQALGLILSKLGMADRIDPLPATAIRMAAATAGVWIMVLAGGRVQGVIRLLKDPPARWATAGASFLGPVFGVWLSLVAVRHTKTGIAATLLAMTPILILPLVILIQKERVSPRAAIGAVVAVGGVILIFLR